MPGIYSPEYIKILIHKIKPAFYFSWRKELRPYLKCGLLSEPGLWNEERLHLVYNKSS